MDNIKIKEVNIIINKINLWDKEDYQKHWIKDQTIVNLFKDINIIAI